MSNGFNSEILERGRLSAPGLAADRARRRIFVNAYRELVGRLALDSSSTVIDVGCGTGEAAEAIAPYVKQVIGIDLSPEIVDVARAAMAGLDARNVSFRVADVCRGSFDDVRGDVIVCLTSIDEIPEKMTALTVIKGHIRGGGSIYVEVRNQDYILKRVFRPLLNILRAIGLVQQFEAAGFRDLTYSEWLELFGSVGLTVERTYPSLRPSYGAGLQRAKSTLARLSRFLPIGHRYMLAFQLKPLSDVD